MLAPSMATDISGISDFNIFLGVNLATAPVVFLLEIHETISNITHPYHKGGMSHDDIFWHYPYQ